jgi:hypothetical protein
VTALIVASALASAASRAGAQSIRVRLLDEETHQPIAGVLVSVLGGSGAVGPAVLASADGIVTVPAADAGPHRLLIRRIGFAPVTTDPVAAPSEPGRTLDIVVPVHRITLSTVRVLTSQPCSEQTESPSAGARVAWTEVRTALEASTLTRDQRLVTTAALSFQRQLGIDGKVQFVDTTLRGRSGERPFIAPAPAVLERDGYYRKHDDGTEDYYAPDEAVLLSDGFTRLHCVSVAPEVRHDSTGTQVALTFAPRGRGSRPDIRGFIWIDSATSDLRRIDFEYVRISFPAPADSIGGSVEFKHLVSGAWIVSSWALRMPRWRLLNRRNASVVLDRYLEVGGSASVVRELATPGANVPRSIVGTVYDSIARGPLSGARVHIADLGREVIADSAGAFRFDSVGVGVHTVWADHPTLDALGLFSLGVRLDATAQAVTDVRLAIPSFATLWQRACGGDPGPRDGDGFVFGRVLSGDSARTPSVATIQLSWDAPSAEGANKRDAVQRTVRADSAGNYAICRVPAQHTVTLTAIRGANSAGPVAFRVGSPRLARQDVTLRPRAAITQGRVIQVIGTDGQPIVYANVSVEGGETRITNEKGEVSLGAGKSQALTVSVRRIGYRPWFGTLALPDTAAVLTVTLPRLAQVLGTVTITGRAMKSPLELTGFYDRWMTRQKGLLSAVFIGPEEIEFRHPDNITNLLRGLNGVCLGHVRLADANGHVGGISKHLFAFSTHPGTLAPSSGSNSCPNCPMAIVIDGKQQSPTPPIDNVLDANDVMAIEVYDRAGNMPISMQFNDTVCGVIALWTGSRKP